MLAAEDRQAIDAWAEAERQRIELERERRLSELQTDLTTSLAEHAAKIDRQIEAIEASIATYRGDVEAFFADLDRETDLVLLAHQAGRRPIFPDLEAIIAGIADSSTPEDEAEVGADPEEDPEAAAEAAGAIAAPMIGVMDPEAAAASVEMEQVPGIAAPSTESVATAAAPGETSTSLFHSLSVARPGNWLRHDPSTADRGNDEESR